MSEVAADRILDIAVEDGAKAAMKASGITASTFARLALDERDAILDRTPVPEVVGIMSVGRDRALVYDRAEGRPLACLGRRDAKLVEWLNAAGCRVVVPDLSMLGDMQARPCLADIHLDRPTFDALVVSTARRCGVRAARRFGLAESDVKELVYGSDPGRDRGHLEGPVRAFLRQVDDLLLSSKKTNGSPASESIVTWTRSLKDGWEAIFEPMIVMLQAYKGRILTHPLVCSDVTVDLSPVMRHGNPSIATIAMDRTEAHVGDPFSVLIDASSM